MYWDHELNGWVLTTHDECRQVTAHGAPFEVLVSHLPDADEIRGRRALQVIHGTAHDRLHAFFSASFAPSRLPDLRRRVIQPVVAEVLHALSGRRRVELASEFADVIPVRIMFALLGFPTSDEELIGAFQTWNAALTAWVQTEGEDRAARERALMASRHFVQLALPIVRQRRELPREDLLSELWCFVPTVFDDCGDVDIFDQCRIVLLAGTEGVSQLICTATFLLLSQQQLRVQITDDPALTSALIEESLRIYPPAQMRPRRATEHTSLGAVEMRPGELCYLDIRQANLDPERHPDPESVDLRREAGSNHLTFSSGARYCVGSALSRAIGVASIDALRTIPSLDLDLSRPPPQLTGFRFAGFRPVHVIGEF
jgi:cytochrome P450